MKNHTSEIVNQWVTLHLNFHHLHFTQWQETDPNLQHNDKTGTNLLTLLSVLCVKYDTLGIISVWKANFLIYKL